MTTQQKIAVMQAHAAGKKIQYQDISHAPKEDWIPTDNPAWNWVLTNYRIDPYDVEMVRVPLDRSFFEGRLVWLKWNPVTGESACHLVTSVSSLRVYIPHNPTGYLYSDFLIGTDNITYSYDCKTWLPCYQLKPKVD